jgi:hypothetical protein
MKQAAPVEFWAWWITSETSGKRMRSRWKMSAETAAAYPGAERVEGTMELRPATPSSDASQVDYPDRMTPDAWIDRCTARLVALIQDEGVSLEDLRAVAVDLAEDRRFNVLEPEAAAELHAREQA